jgi:hypothetical protein
MTRFELVIKVLQTIAFPTWLHGLVIQQRYRNPIIPLYKRGALPFELYWNMSSRIDSNYHILAPKARGLPLPYYSKIKTLQLLESQRVRNMKRRIFYLIIHTQPS